VIAKSRKTKWFLFVISAILVGVFCSLLITQVGYVNIDYSSRNSSQQYLIGLVWAIGILLSLFFLPVKGEEKRALMWLWVFKSFVTLGFMIIYESIYTLDARLYYQHALTDDFHFSLDDINGTESITALVWLMMRTLPVFESYHAIKVIFSFFGLIGIYFFYKAFANYFKASVKLLWFLGLFPSIIFWSSILGKDPLGFLGIGLFTYGACKLFKETSLRAILILGVAAVMMAFVRLWTPIIFAIPIALSFALAPPSKEKKQLPRWFIVTAMVAALYVGIGSFANKLQLDNLEETNKRVNLMSRSWANAGGSGQKPPEFRSMTDIIKFIPVGGFTAMFRPLPGEINNPFGIIAGFENFFMLLCICFYFYKRGLSELDHAFGRYLLITPLVWSSIYGFFSYQNLGTAVRFKLQILPFLLILAYRVAFREETESVAVAPEKSAPTQFNPAS
jgi:hypothetical protein